MSDPLATNLARLAPTVDLDASRELFESLRHGDASGGEDRPDRRWAVAAACVVLIIAGLAGVWALAGSDQPAPAVAPTPAGTGDGTEFRLIAMEPVGDFDRRGIHVAETSEGLEELLRGYRDSFVRYAGEITFGSSAEIAVVVERSDDACPLELERFIPFESAWRAEWAEKSPEPCEAIGLGWVYLVAIERGALAGIDRFVLPAEQLGSTELPELSVAVPGTATPVEPVVERPPVPAPQEREARLARFPMSNEGDPEDLAALIAAHGRGEDWTGTVSGVLFHAVSAGEWWLCSEILESFPEQCGTGLRLLDAPALFLAQPGLFDEQRSEDTGPVAVVISRGSHPVVGTWFDDAAIFVEHGTQTPTTSEPTTAPTSASESTTIGTIVMGDEVGQHIVAGIAAAAGPAELDELISRAGLDVPQPAVDFGIDVVIGVSIVDDDCPAALIGFIFDAGNSDEAASLSAAFDDAPDDCGGLGTVRSFLAVIPRSALADRFIAAIPAGYTAGRPAETLIDLTIAAPEQLLVAESSAPLGTIVAARDQATYGAMWEQLDATVEPPNIDFDRQIAVAFVIPDDACPPTFDGFDAVPGNPYPLWTPRFVETETACRLPLISRLYVIIIDRAALGAGVTFRLAGDTTYGFPEQLYELRLAEPSLVSATPSCGPTDAPAVDVFVFFNIPIDVRVVVRDGTTLGEQRLTYDAALAGEVHGGVVRQVPIDTPAAPTPFGEVLLVDGEGPDRILDRIPFDRTSVPDGFGCG